MSEDLAARITRLEDIEAIKQLKARYCEICDDDHNPDDIVTIFTPDAIWEGKDIDKATGHAELRELFIGFQKRISFSQHMAMNPIIEVTGTTAKARWYFFGPFTMRRSNGDLQARWLSTRYHEDYVKTADGWKFQHLRVMGPGIAANYEQGWAAK